MNCSNPNDQARQILIQEVAQLTGDAPKRFESMGLAELEQTRDEMLELLKLQN